MESVTNDRCARAHVASPNAHPVLLVTAGGRILGFPLESVLETMRPLPTQHIPGLPQYLRGLAVIRGGPVPVVDLRVFFDPERGTVEATVGRYVLLAIKGERAAVAVEAVLGLWRLDTLLIQDLPPLLQEVRPDCIKAVGVLDEQLLLILEATRVIPEDVWHALKTHVVTQ